MKAGAILVLSAFVFGCGPFVETNSVDPQTAARLDSEVKLYQPPELRSLKYTTIGRIESWSCKNKLWDPDPTPEDAISQMKLKASSFGAKGIVDVQCSREGTSLATNCWSSIVCFGTAIKVDAGPVEMKLRIAAPIAALAAIVVAQAASAADRGWYVSGMAGLTFAEDANGNDGGIPFTTSFDTGFNLAGAGGYAFPNGLRLLLLIAGAAGAVPRKSRNPKIATAIRKGSKQ